MHDKVYQSRALEKAFRKLRVKVRRVDARRVRTRHGVWYAAMPPTNTKTAIKLTNDKVATQTVLSTGGVPVSGNLIAPASFDHARALVDHLGGYPVVTKPNGRVHGDGVTVDIRDDTTLEYAVDQIAAHWPRVIVERHLEGDFRRVVVARGRVVQIVHNDKAFVIGDGLSTVRQLVDRIHADRRGWPMKPADIRIDPLVLKRQGYDAEGIPGLGRRVYVEQVNNASSGVYTVLPVDDHPECAAVAVKATELVGLDLSTVELMWTEGGPVVFEVNGKSNLRQHILAEPEVINRIARLYK